MHQVTRIRICVCSGGGCFRFGHGPADGQLARSEIMLQIVRTQIMQKQGSYGSPARILCK